jgi:hypothetical protein
VCLKPTSSSWVFYCPDSTGNAENGYGIVEHKNNFENSTDFGSATLNNYECFGTAEIGKDEHI